MAYKTVKMKACTKAGKTLAKRKTLTAKARKVKPPVVKGAARKLPKC